MVMNYKAKLQRGFLINAYKSNYLKKNLIVLAYEVFLKE